MSLLVRDSKNIRNVLKEISCWESRMLNRLYDTNLFTKLESKFQEDQIDYVLLLKNIHEILEQLKKARYLQDITSINHPNLVAYVYNINHIVDNLSEKFIEERTKHNHLKIIHSFNLDSQSKQAFHKLGIDSGKDDPNDLFLVMNALNALSSSDSVGIHFNVLDILNAIRENNDEYFISKDYKYIDVLILSSLGRCKIWNRILKHPENAAKRLNKFYEWYRDIKIKYAEFLDFQIHVSMQSKKHLVQATKRYYLSASYPEFINAVRNSQYEKIRHFLDSGVSVNTIDPSSKNATALHIACQQGDIKTIKILEEYDCDFEVLDFEHLTPLFYAVFGERFEVIEYLLTKGVNLNHKDHQDRTVFYCACCQCSTKMVDFLYRKGCDINSKTKLERLPLAKAAYFGRADVVKLLLSYKEVIIESKDHKGRTALHNACWGKEGGREGKKCGSNKGMDTPEAVQALLEKGANIEAKDCDGNTPLAVAASTHADRSLPILMQFGADVNSLNNNLETPLFQASRYGHIQICKMLLEQYKADPFLVNNKGVDSIQISIENNHFELSKYYLEHIFSIRKDVKYWETILNMIVRHFNEHQKEVLLSIYLKQQALFQTELSREILKALICCKHQAILMEVIKNLKSYSNESPSEKLQNQIDFIFQELISVEWIAGARMLKSEFEMEFSKLNWRLCDLNGITKVKPTEFLDLLKDFNINIWSHEGNYPSFLHELIKVRNTELILGLFEILTNSMKPNNGISNSYLKEVTSKDISSLLSIKNEHGLTPLEYALVHKYYDISNIIKNFIGEKLENNIYIMRYNLQITEKNPSYNHSKKEELIQLSRMIKSHRTLEELPSYVYFELNEVKLIKEKLQNLNNETLIPEVIDKLLSAKEVQYISSENELKAMAEEISHSSLIGVDLEYYLEDPIEKVGFVCLLQISTVSKDYLIDGLTLHQSIHHYLSHIFSSHKIKKVFHGCDNDLKWLKCNFEIDVVNLYDTSKAYMIIENTKVPCSLSFLTKTYLGYQLDKSYQKADWRIRPLPKAMLDYARIDASILLFLWYKLNCELTMEQRLLLERKMAKKCWKTIEGCMQPKIHLEFS